MPIIKSCVCPREVAASNDLVTNCTLILSTKLTKGDVSYPGTVGTSVSAVSYNGTGFAAFIVVR